MSGDDAVGGTEGVFNIVPNTLAEIDEQVFVAMDPIKGRCLYSRKYFAPGSLIFAESPACITFPNSDPALWSYFEDLQEEQAFELESVAFHFAAVCSLLHETSRVREILLQKWVYEDELTPDVDTLRFFHNLPNSGLPEEVIQKIQDFPVELVQRLVCTWRYNAFGHHYEEKNGMVLYDRISYLSHSCRQTCVWLTADNESTFVLRARTVINPGDELSLSYLPEEDLLKPIRLRRAKLLNWKFICRCKRCESPIDETRGFLCTSCNAGTCYFRMDPSDPSLESCETFNPSKDVVLDTTPCTLCSSVISSEESDIILRHEALYFEILNSENEELSLKDLESYMGNADLLFRNHWILCAIASQLYSRYLDRGFYYESMICQQRYIAFIEGVNLGGVSLSLAWAHQSLGDLHGRLCGFLGELYESENSVENIVDQSALRAPNAQSEVTARLGLAEYELAYRMLSLLCGEPHSYTQLASNRYQTLRKAASLLCNRDH